MTHDSTRRWRRLALGAAFAVLVTPGGAFAADHLELPPGPNRDLVYGACRTCHDLQYLIESAGIPRDAWDDVIHGMRQYGLRIPDDRRAKILDYLGTYLGPNPPAQTAAATEGGAAPETATEAADGKALFAEQCAACHQPDGKGQPGAFPPLAGNRDLMRDRDFPVYVVLHGLAGRITVEGKEFNGEMPPFDHLSNAEIAAVVDYVRGAWNNAAMRPAGLAPVDAATVEKLRAKEMTSADVHAYRAKLP